jgi:hypothetical protein
MCFVALVVRTSSNDKRRGDNSKDRLLLQLLLVDHVSMGSFGMQLLLLSSVEHDDVMDAVEAVDSNERFDLSAWWCLPPTTTDTRIRPRAVEVVVVVLVVVPLELSSLGREQRCDAA